MPQPALKLLFSRQAIAGQVHRLADEISRDYGQQELVLVGVLKGSFFFLADLARQVSSPVLIDFVRLASYGSETRSSGIVEFRQDLELPIRDRHVLIVEDIIDSGNTLETLYHRLLLRQPRSLRVCALLDKRGRREVNIDADYVGMVFEEGFVVGYGLDLDEQYRHLPDIYQLEEM